MNKESFKMTVEEKVGKEIGRQLEESRVERLVVEMEEGKIKLDKAHQLYDKIAKRLNALPQLDAEEESLPQMRRRHTLESRKERTLSLMERLADELLALEKEFKKITERRG